MWGGVDCLGDIKDLSPNAFSATTELCIFEQGLFAS